MLEEEAKTVAQKLWDAFKSGELTNDAINSNYVEFWYIEKFHNAVVHVDGVPRGPGWLAKDLGVNVETVRTVASKLRSAKAKGREQEYIKLFGIKI